ncbi:methyltransferase domain-containing protein [Mesorhizobium yinganensis]|uniref:methyltransferase domain-containing protein n=1 Tax=Mesorhizobium yinganensis TaxID=3157707 RepID=UPI003CCD5D6B
MDVGTGVAGIALEAARTCPNIRVDGIDIWEPALELAKQNVAESPYADRVSVRNLDVSRLDEYDRYSLAWLPTMFLKRPIVEAALDRARLGQQCLSRRWRLYPSRGPFFGVHGQSENTSKRWRNKRSGRHQGDDGSPRICRSRDERDAACNFRLRNAPLRLFRHATLTSCCNRGRGRLTGPGDVVFPDFGSEASIVRYGRRGAPPTAATESDALSLDVLEGVEAV